LCLNCKVRLAIHLRLPDPEDEGTVQCNARNLSPEHRVMSQQICSFSVISHTTTVRVSNWPTATHTQSPDTYIHTHIVTRHTHIQSPDTHTYSHQTHTHTVTRHTYIVT